MTNVSPSIIFGSIGVVVLLLQVFMFVVIKFNDLKHLSRSVGEIKSTLHEISEDIKVINKDISSVKERISRIEGILRLGDED